MNPHRLPFLDSLRVAAFALLIPYHVGMYYVTWDWHVKSPSASEALEPFMMLSSAWRLGLLFLIAGAAAQGLFARRGAVGVLKDRSLPAASCGVAGAALRHCCRIRRRRMDLGIGDAAGRALPSRHAGIWRADMAAFGTNDGHINCTGHFKFNF